MVEIIPRIAVFLILAGAISFAIYFRCGADARSGGAIPREVDGKSMMLLIRVGGICLWVAPMIYVFAPRAVVWSKMGLPDWVRIVGMVLGVLMLGAIWSLYVSIGKNVSATGSTRRHHELITNGPYQWIRHPLYTFGVILFFGLGLTADSWFIIVLGVFAFLLMAARIPREEANLIAAFGSDYERYREKTGKFLPRFRVRS